MPVLTETLMGIGAHELALRSIDPNLLDELRAYRHLLYWWRGRLIFAGPILQPPRRNLRIAGAGMLWHLGVDQVGPTIRDRTVLSGRTVLANGDFQYGDLYWHLQEATAWTVTSGGAAIDPLAVLTARDILQAEQAVEVQPGQEWRIVADASRAAPAAGRLRLRPVLTGRFAAGEHLSDPSFDASPPWTDISPAGFGGVMQLVSDAANSRTGTGVVRIGEHPRPNLMSSPLILDREGGVEHPDAGFEEASAHTDEVARSWLGYNVTGGGPPPASVNFERAAGIGRSGSYGLKVPTGLPLVGQFDDYDYVDYYDQDAAIVPIPLVRQGEEYCFGMYVRSDGASAGEVWFGTAFAFESPLPTTPVGFCDNADATMQPDEFQDGPHQSSTNGDWKRVLQNVRIPDGAYGAYFRIFAKGIDAGAFYVDDCFITAHNTPWTALSSEGFAVETGRRYRAECWFRKDDGAVTGSEAVGGEVRIAVVLTDSLAANPDQVLYSSSLTDTQGQWAPCTLDFEIPDGYDGIRLEIHARNVDRGYWWADDASYRTSDTATWEDWAGIPLMRWDETDSASEGRTRTLTIPDGAERLQLEWVAETGAGGWVAQDVSLIRTDQEPADAAEVAASLCRDPDTGEPLLQPVTFNAGDILFDKRWRDTLNGDALRELSRNGLVQPAREFAVRHPDTLAWGLASQIFSDRTDLILTPTDFVMLAAPDLTEEAHAAAQTIRVIGAEVRNSRGERRTIVGEAATGAGGATYAGDPLNRILTVQDSQLDHPAFAQAWAEYLAGRQAPASTVRLAIASHETIGRFEMGDWIYLSDPDNGLEDPDNPMPAADGRTVYPRRLRVIERSLTCGEPGSFRVEVRREDGSVLDISERVDWPERTEATVTLGDPLADFSSDPAGGPVGLQLLRFRQAVTRGA